MNIYMLEPIDKNHKIWQSSKMKNTIIVRAENPDKARRIVQLEYWFGEDIPVPTDEFLGCPWLQEEYVSCTIIENSKYDEKGDTGILDELSC